MIKDERRAIIATAWASIAMAGIAILTLGVQSCQNRDLLKQAQEEHAEQLTQSEAERTKWQKTFEEAETNRLASATQFNEQLRLAKETATRHIEALTTATAQQKRQSDQALAAQKQMWDEEKAQQRLLYYEERSPRITPCDCCSYQVAIILVPPSQSLGHVLLPYSEPQKREFPAHYNTGYVTKLQNLGGGPAEKLQIDWIVKEIQRSKDGQIQVETLEFDKWQHTMRDTYPAYVKSGGETEIRSLPSCIVFDTEENIVSVAGDVIFQYYHIMDQDTQPTRLTCDFWIQPRYKAEKRDGIEAAPPALHVHIGDFKRVGPASYVQEPINVPTERVLSPTYAEPTQYPIPGPPIEPKPTLAEPLYAPPVYSPANQ